MFSKIGALGFFALMLLGVCAAQGADEYRIGPGDVLAISVWERPELTRTIVVRESGIITFPPIGEIEVVDRTSADLARILEQRLNDFLRRPTQVTVEILAFNSQRVTVAGAVGTPGRISFERLPSLLEVLGAAGGLGPEADLSRVQIYRLEEGTEKSMTVDLSESFRTGDIQGLPRLVTGDVIYVPSASADVAGGGSVAFLVGEISRPGAYPVGRGMDLLKLLAVAGGALPSADLRRIEVISQGAGDDGGYTVTVDLERYLDGKTNGFEIRPGDTVRLLPRTGRGAGLAWAVTREVLGVSSNILSLVLSWDILKDR